MYTDWIARMVLVATVASVPTDGDAISPPPPSLLPPGYCPPLFRQPPRPCPVLNFSNAYGDNMVLQAGVNQPATVWGFCPPDAKVTVAFAGEQIQANVSAWLNRSTWSARLPPTAATFSPQNITASCCGNATATLSNVLFGDVWVCSGQSNMAYTVGGSKCWTNKSATDPRTYDCVNNSGIENDDAKRYGAIRLYQQGSARMANHPPAGYGYGSPEPMAESSPDCSDGIPACSAWGTTANGVGSFSAVCWFFGRDLFDSLSTKVPIGLIESDVGGTPVQDWSPPSAIEQCSAVNLTAQERGFVATYNYSSVLWNSKIVPLLRTTVKGVVWFQGEQNAGIDGREYKCSFPAMIRQWRSIWATSGTTHATFPFGFVQLDSVGTPSDYGNWTYRNPPNVLPPPQRSVSPGDPFGIWSGWPGFPSVRLAQVEALRLPNTFQAISLDTPFFSGAIHSPYKQPVGARLAFGALSVAYGLSKYAPPSYNPTGATAMVHSNGSATVKMVGLPANGLLPVRRRIGFEILGASGFWISTPIVHAEGDTVTLDGCPSGPKALRYLWYNCPCTTRPFRCPLYIAVPAIGNLSGELTSIPIGPFVLTKILSS